MVVSFQWSIINYVRFRWCVKYILIPDWIYSPPLDLAIVLYILAPCGAQGVVFEELSLVSHDTQNHYNRHLENICLIMIIYIFFFEALNNLNLTNKMCVYM
jgi:hypothetical protein